MIKSIRIKNFKALRDTGEISLPDFGVFIGNNGSGKSSILEALNTLQNLVKLGISKAFEPYGDLENVRHYNSKLDEVATTKSGFKRKYEPVEFIVKAEIKTCL